MKNTLVLRLLVFSLSFTFQSVYAYVAGATSVPAGGFEATMKAEFMRGLAGPENLPETQQKQTPSVDIYEVSGGYNLGNYSIFQDLKIRLIGNYYTSASELLNGNEIYPKDEGWVLGGEVSANFVHEADKVFGIFLRTQNPLSMNVEKFVNPKIDRFGLGIQSGFKFSDHFGQETVLFVGSGISDGGFRQNASVSASLLGVWILSGGVFKNGAAVRLGPFYDGDIAERNDARYNTQGVRAFRLGLVAAASYSFVKDMTLDVSYIQKFTGAYFRATKDISVSLRTVF